jgi:hypothetical protein
MGLQLYLIKNSSSLCVERNRENLLCYYNIKVHAHFVLKRNQLFFFKWLLKILIDRRHSIHKRDFFCIAECFREFPVSVNHGASTFLY